MPSSPVSVAELDACPHPRGPGISVCLRCRAEANQRAAARRRRYLERGGGAAVVMLVALVAGTRALGDSGRSRMPRDAAGTPEAMPARPAERFTVTQASAEEPRRGGAPVAALPALHALPASTLAAGPTDLGEGRSAERDGDRVLVHFDTPVFRTRRRDKFEQTVRSTLPRVYGALADSALAELPIGELAATGDLLTELPARGIALPAQQGTVLTLWPLTRPGQDGPLVVGYRVSVGARRD